MNKDMIVVKLGVQWLFITSLWSDLSYSQKILCLDIINLKLMTHTYAG